LRQILRNMRRHETLTSLAMAIILSLLIYYPVVLGGVAAPLQLLHSDGGWEAVSDRAVVNPVLADVADQILAYRKFTLTAIKHGQIPLYNDELFNGEAYLANVQSAVFNPLNLLGIWFDFLTVHNIIVVSQLVLALWFSFLLLRELGLRYGGASTGAIAFGLCSYLTVWAEWGSVGTVLCWLPLVLYFIHRYLTRGKINDGIGAACALGAQFYFGHFQFSLFIYLTAALYTLCLWVAHRMNWRRISSLACFAILGLLLGAPQILPALEASSIGYRAFQHNYFQFQAVASVPQTIAQFFEPNAYGISVQNNYHGRHNYNEATSFIGFFAITLALVAFVRGRRGRWFFILLGLLAMSCATGSILYRPLWAALPPLQSLPAVRFLALVQFSLCMLAGYGADWLIGRVHSGISRWQLGYLGILLVLSSIILVVSNTNLVHIPYHGGRHLIYPYLGVVVIVSIIVVTFRLRRSALLAVVIPTLVFVEGAIFLHSYLPFTSRADYAAGNPAFAYIASMSPNVHDYRIIPADALDFNMYYGLAQPVGYDSLYPQANLLEQMALEGASEPISHDPLGFVNSIGSTQLANLGVRYIIKNPTLPQQNVIDVPLNFHLARDFGDQRVYESNTLVTSYYLASSVRLESTETQLKSLAGLSLHQLIGDLPDTASGTGAIRPTETASGLLAVHASMSEAGYLNSGQSYSKNWHAKIDGRSVAVYRVNYNFAAVRIPAGSHDIRFSYQPASFLWGLRIFAAGLFLILVLVVGAYYRRRGARLRANKVE
jgi:hypothetical protein